MINSRRNFEPVDLVVLTIVVFVVYLLSSNFGNPFDHYARLADAFLHGRLYLTDAPTYLELARFGFKAFVIEPPMPAILLLPFVALFGAAGMQVVAGALFGALAVGLFWFACLKLYKNVDVATMLAVLLAFGTNLWWASTDGNMWAFSHVACVFFLSAALLESTGRARPWLLAAFVGMAGLSRLPAFLTFPFFLYAALSNQRKQQARSGLIVFFAVFALFVLAYFGFNFARYGTFADAGYYHSQFDGLPWFSEGRFSLNYLPRQLNALLFALPDFSSGFPKPTVFGLSLFLTTPFLLLAFLAPLTKRNVALLLSIIFPAAVWLTYGATGVSQFGYRFSLDALLFMIILANNGAARVPKWIVLLLFFASIIVNAWAISSFILSGNWP